MPLWLQIVVMVLAVIGGAFVLYQAVKVVAESWWAFRERARRCPDCQQAKEPPR